MRALARFAMSLQANSLKFRQKDIVPLESRIKFCPRHKWQIKLAMRVQRDSISLAGVWGQCPHYRFAEDTI